MRWDEAFERLQFHEILNGPEGFEAGEELEIGQRNCNLGFVVGVAKSVGILLMELAGERQVGVDLQGKRLAEGEDLACQLLYMEV